MTVYVQKDLKENTALIVSRSRTLGASFVWKQHAFCLIIADITFLDKPKIAKSTLI